MGQALAASYPAARAVFDEADYVLGFPISRLCFEGPEEQLKLTENTQPALLTVSIAAWSVLREQGFKPDYVAGHSLGEYSALVAAGALKFADALRLVRHRGRYMQEAVPPDVGAMAALLRLPSDKLDGVLNEAAQGEVLIAGHAGAVHRAVELAKAAGARRGVLLPVSAPFHCALMEPAQRRLKVDLDATAFADLEIPLINNWQARAVTTGAEARAGLFQQVPGSVLWTNSMRLLIEAGAERFVEVGVGAVLCGLLKNIDPARRAVAFSEPADLEKVRELLA
jgi:[acyl-carrier-protein] S-malonyltransferase